MTSTEMDSDERLMDVLYAYKDGVIDDNTFMAEILDWKDDLIRLARLNEAELRYWYAKNMLERAHKWQLTEEGRHDMILGEVLLPAQDRVIRLKGLEGAHGNEG